MFKSVDILCVPATMDAAFDAEVRYPTKQVDQSFSNYLGWMMPAATVSVLLDHNYGGVADVESQTTHQTQGLAWT